MAKNMIPTSHSARQVGATLIETMVSLFIFAVGALGIAAMQTSSLVRVDDTKQRSLAIWKAQELADRMRNTKTVDDPDGLLPEFLAEINNDNSGDTIGAYGTSDFFVCPNTVPTRCDDVSGSATTACSTAAFVEFEVWSVMCDPSSGVAVGAGNVNDGAIGLRDVELAMVQNGTEFRLYIEWLSRSANSDQSIQETDTTLAARTVSTNLCGDAEDVDSRLDVYCLKFE